MMIFYHYPLSFKPGNYSITLFQVLDDRDQAVAMTPLSGSELSNYVENPLERNFTIVEDQTERVNLEVISTEGEEALSFGYSTFSFVEVELFSFLLGVFVYEEESQNFELTNSHINISAGSKVFYDDNIVDSTQTFKLIDNADDYPTYVITVTKDGYKTYADTLTLENIKLYENDPKEIVLEKSTTVEVTSSMDSLNYIIGYATTHRGNRFIIKEDVDVISSVTWTSGNLFTSRHYIKFTQMSEIPKGDVIDSAYIDLVYTDLDKKQRLQADKFYTRHDYKNKGVVALFQRITSDWGSSTTYSTKPSSTSENQVILPNILDYQSLGRVPPNFSDQKFKIDITALTQDIVDNGNYGIMMRMQYEELYRMYAFYSFTHPDENKRAVLKVYYH